MYGSNNAISRIDSEGQDDVGLQELSRAKIILFLKEETPLYVEPKTSPSYLINGVTNGHLVGQPVFVFDETEYMYYVALQFFEGGKATTIDYGWIQKEVTSKTLWNLFFGENQVYESADTIYPGVETLQKLLQDIGYEKVERNGKYDLNTINAVSNIQSRYRIGEDGKAGKKTFICVVWEWLLYACKYDRPIRLIDKTNNPDFVIN